MKRRIAIALALGLNLLSPGLRAQPSPTELVVARQLFQEATELEGRSEWRAARAKLAEAMAIKETPGLRFHLGYCAEQLGELVTALIEYERALDLIRAGNKAPDVERLLEPARARVQARVAHLTLRLPSDAQGAEVLLDGKKLAPAVLGRSAPIDPGAHQVRVNAPGDRVAHLELQLREGEQRTVHIVLKPAAQAAPPSPPSPATQPAPRAAEPRPAAAPASAAVEPASRPRAEIDDSSGVGKRELVLIGESTVALAGLGVGIGFLIARSSARERVEAAQTEIDAIAGSDASNACATPDFPGRPACDDLRAAVDDYDRAGVISTVGFVAAGAGAAATVLTFVLWKPEGRPAVALGPASFGSGLALRGAF